MTDKDLEKKIVHHLVLQSSTQIRINKCLFCLSILNLCAVIYLLLIRL
jgi:hypothetical protein